MGPVGRAIAIGVGAVGVYGVVSALLDGNDVAVPEADHKQAAANAKKTLEKSESRVARCHCAP